jgi:Phage major capsid protein E
MPNPTASQLHVDSLLSNVAQTYVQKADHYACLALPTVPVAKQSDKYAVWSKADYFRSEAAARADGAHAKRSGFGVTTSSTYYAEVYALEKVITRRQRSNAKGELDIEKASVNYLTNQLLMKRESLFATNLMVADTWANTDFDGASSTSGVSRKYWDASGSAPIQDITDGHTNIIKSTGYKPNTLIVGHAVNAALMNHADILDRIKYTQTGITTSGLLAQVFGVDRYIVSSATNNTAAEGASATMAFQTGNHALLCYLPTGPVTDEASAAYCFSWQEFDEVGSDGQVAIRRYEEPQTDGDVLLAQMAFDVKLTGSDLGQFYNIMITP